MRILRPNFTETSNSAGSVSMGFGAYAISTKVLCANPYILCLGLGWVVVECIVRQRVI